VVEDVVGAVGRPDRQTVMVGVGQRPATPDGDEPRVANLAQDQAVATSKMPNQ
jgi:hypothetical protein